MERAKRDDLSFSQKRSFTFGAYGRWVIAQFVSNDGLHSVWMNVFFVSNFASQSCFHFLLFTAWTDSCMRMKQGEVPFFYILLQLCLACIQALEWYQWEHSCISLPTHNCCCRIESDGENLLDVLDSPAPESKTLISACSNQRVVSLPCPAWA